MPYHPPAGSSTPAREVFLDTADGLDHKTVCRCHIIVEFVREKVLPPTGRISTVRQLAIRRKVREIFGL